MSKTQDLRPCGTAYDCRDELPELAAWMGDDDLKEIIIWRGGRFERGQMYFDLDHPERGPFVATGDESPPSDHTYVRRDGVTERVWTRLITWRQPVSPGQGHALQENARDLGIPRES